MKKTVVAMMAVVTITSFALIYTFAAEAPVAPSGEIPSDTTQTDMEPFVTTWQTATAGESITIPVGGAPGTYTIDWGDGTVSADVSGDQTHTYDTAGDHTIRIYGDFTRIHLNGEPAADNLQSIDQWGDIEWSSMNSAFRGASNMRHNP